MAYPGSRSATVQRTTNETQMEVFIDLDGAMGSSGAQDIDISTGIGFLDHVRTGQLPNSPSLLTDTVLAYRCTRLSLSTVECR
jgi:imidazoleglycerol-phosphate dehydratase